MKKFARILCLLLAMIMVFGLVACGGGSETSEFVIAFCEYQYHCEMAHQRSDDVGAGIAYSEGDLSKLGGKSQQHEHRDKNGSQDSPFCRSRAHKKIYNSGKKNKQQH